MNVLKPHQRTTVATLLEAGTSQRQIGRLTGVDRKTIRAVALALAAERSNSPGVATGSAPQTPPPRPPAPAPTSVSACEPHRAFIEAQLRLKRNFMAIYQDLVDQHGFAGAYNSVKRFAGGLRERAPEQFDRLEFAPGEEAQVDYGEGALTRVAGTQRYRKPRLFVMTLRYSRRSFRRVVWKSSQETWARLHEDAWRYFGGSTRYVVLDNLKEGVVKPDLYEPAYFSDRGRPFQSDRGRRNGIAKDTPGRRTSTGFECSSIVHDQPETISFEAGVGAGSGLIRSS